MLFQNLNRRAEIGANSYLITLGDTRIVLDAGMHPKETGHDALPAFDRLEYDSVDAIIITHAHLDHVGSLPILARQQPSAPIYLTEPTGDLSEAMLHNCVNVMKSQRQELGVTEYPLFTHRELDAITHGWQTRPTRKPFPIGKESDGIECEFFDAGHVLGSVGVMLRYRDQRVFYTGDVNFEDQTLSKAASFPEEHVDTLIIETTRGGEARPEGYTRAQESARLAAAIQNTLGRGGAVLIPVFAMGKTQEVLTMIDGFKRDERILDVPVFIGGLSTKMTTIYDRHAGNSHRHHPDFRILRDMDLVLSSRPRGRDRRKKGRNGAGPRAKNRIRYMPGSIYALSSGMMTEHTLSNSFARNILPDPCNSILFVGYADPESPAGKIKAAAPGDSISLNSEGPALPLCCEVESFDFSGHSIREALHGYLRKTAPKKALLVHGNESACDWFRSAAAESLAGTETLVPQPGEKLHL